MRKILSLLVVLAMATSMLHAQTATTGLPYSFGKSSLSQSVDVREMPQIDQEKLFQEDAAHTDKTDLFRVGVGFSVNNNRHNSGRIDITDDGGTLWRTKYVSKDAVMTYLVFEDFNIPEEGQMYIYSPDHQQVYGPYTNKDVQSVGRFESDNIIGDELVVEYYEPANAAFKGEFQIAGVMHIYKDFLGVMKEDKGPHGDAEGNCHIDVICPEVQQSWHYPVNSVVCIAITANVDGNLSAYLCSGALVNNVRMDKTPYVLSANHCVASDNQTYKFYFNYQVSTCGGNTGTYAQMSKGGQIMARSSANSETYATSDFLLLKITGNLGASYRDSLFFAGWDRSGAFSTGIGIHHPGGDWKKASFPKSMYAPSSGYYANKFLVVSWFTNPNKGVTEQGSSGSPLFDSKSLIIGTLTGGSSYCYDPAGTDLYGRMSYHWFNNGATANDRKLQPWLDPDNTGAMTLPGMKFTGEIVTGITDYTQATSTFEVIPNPTRDGIITIQGDFMNENALCSIYNVMGQLVMTQTITTDASFQMNVSGLDNGVYIMDIQGGNRNYKSKLIISK